MRRTSSPTGTLTGEQLRVAFERHYSTLLRLCVLFTEHRETAEDIAQEAFARAACKLDEIEPDAWGPYLRRTAINLWKNHLRRLSVDLRARARLGGPVSHRLGRTESDLDVWQAVRRLPFRQRACVVLRFYEGLSEREVAEALGCSAGTVKTHTSRAMAKLRRLLSDEG